jgi:N-acyl-D-amino-acid deacylase
MHRSIPFETVTTPATCANPPQYASGVEHVFVNGGHVIKDGAHTGAMPARVGRAPGWRR